MQVYRVEVANRDTGKTEVIAVEAASADDAVRIANERGWLVSKVEEVPPVIQPIPIHYTPRRAKSRGGVSAARIVGALMIALTILSLVFTSINRAGQYELKSALEMRRLQDHAFRGDVAAGATANDLHDLLYEVKGLREELHDEANMMAYGLLFWGGVILLAVGGRKTPDKQ